MSDALKSRLSAERLFTATDMAEVARASFEAASLYAGVKPTEARIAAGVFGDETLIRILATVQAHLSSDTTTIRPLKT